MSRKIRNNSGTDRIKIVDGDIENLLHAKKSRNWLVSPKNQIWLKIEFFKSQFFWKTNTLGFATIGGVIKPDILDKNFSNQVTHKIPNFLSLAKLKNETQWIFF